MSYPSNPNQPQGQQYGPGQQQHGGYPSQPSPPKKNWFLRHKFLTALLALVIIGIAAGVGGGSSSNDSANKSSGSSSSSESSSSEKTSEKAAEKLAAVGTPVRDGKFEFTVTKVERGVKNVGGEYGQNAQGEYTLVYVTVKNIGDQQQGLSDSEQKAFDTKATQYSADSTAGVYIKGNDVLFNQINPGNQVKGTLVFDAPAGTKLTQIEFHDSVFSGGVKASLEQ